MPTSPVLITLHRIPQTILCPPGRLLHSSSLMAISDFSVGYGTWPPIGWCYRMCDWLKWISTGVYLQGAELWLLHPWLMLLMAISTVSSEGLWEYLGLAQMGLPLGLCKVICSIVYVQRREWMDPMSSVKILTQPSMISHASQMGYCGALDGRCGKMTQY